MTVDRIFSGLRVATRRFMVLLLLPLALAGCSGRGGPVPYDVQNFGAPDVPVRATANEAYRLGVGDTISVVVFNVTEFSAIQTFGWQNPGPRGERRVTNHFEFGQRHQIQ